MRLVLGVVTAGLALWLAWAAKIDPAVPYLSSAGGLTWWLDPQPLSGHGPAGPCELTFEFTPQQAGPLKLAVLGSFRLRGDDVEIAAGDGASWKRSITVEVAAAQRLSLVAIHPTLLPAVGFGGPAAPTLVHVVRRGERVVATPAELTLQVASPLGPRAPFLAGLAIAALGMALLACLGGRPTPTAHRPRLLLTVVGLHAAAALWNAAGYPIERGLDAAGHIEYARLIAAEVALPAPSRGWQTYHPPLYYLVGAAGLKLTGDERSLQYLSSLAGTILIGLVAWATRDWRATLVVAAAPVLLVTEPQATNEVWLAALVTASLVTATRATTWRGAVAVGFLLGAALLCKYTAIVFVVPCLVALAYGAATRTAALRLAAIALAVAAIVSGWVYVDRLHAYQDPFIGNWDDRLGQPYRQPPGVRFAPYFWRFGASLVAHPYAARQASLWDALWASTVNDAYGRRLGQDAAQHYLAFLVSLAALPLAACILCGLASMAPGLGRLEIASLLTCLLAVAAFIRFNLELPYWSTAKGVFLLGLALPGAAAFGRGRDCLRTRFGPTAARFIDAALACYVLGAAVAYVLWPQS